MTNGKFYKVYPNLSGKGLDDLFGDTMAAFDDIFRPMFQNKNKISDAVSNQIKYPKCEAFETENETVINFAVPGIDVEDINISLEKDLLTVSYEKKEGNEIPNKRIILSELRKSSWKRSFKIFSDIIEEQIKASLDKGILTITIPFKEKTKIPIAETRKIQISTEK